MKPGKILLTGASSGIGAALARQLAGANVHMGLVARRRGRLEALREELLPRGTKVEVYEADVRDAVAMRQVADSFVEAANGVTLAIANAGVSRPDALYKGDPDPVSDLIAVNIQGTLNTLVPLIPHMIAVESGHLAVVGSVAGFRGLPGKGAYCASKAAQKMLMDSYRPVLRRHGIAVTTICPGWVHSELTENSPYPMPFIMSAERAAALIVRALAKRRKTYVFPWQMRVVLPIMRTVPERWLPMMGARR